VASAAPCVPARDSVTRVPAPSCPRSVRVEEPGEKIGCWRGVGGAVVGRQVAEAGPPDEMASAALVAGVGDPRGEAAVEGEVGAAEDDAFRAQAGAEKVKAAAGERDQAGADGLAQSLESLES
jgi:hypothetical protein